MDAESPPKRVTRSRAAAKATDPAPPKVKIATAATRAKATRPVTTTTTAAPTTKRKTRADETHDEDELANNEDEQPMEKKKSEPARTARGRAKKPLQEEPEPSAQDVSTTAPSTRGRPKKPAVESIQPEPVRSTRGRPKKTETASTEEPPTTLAAEPVKKITRGRVATTRAPVAAKKNVTFEEKHELDKENKLPTRAVRGKAKVEEEPTGLRAKPIRRAAIAPAPPRATRGRAKTVTESEQPEIPAQKSSPLSPKKVTQIATAKEPSSDDELSTMHKTPMKSLTRSPLKPPGSILDATKRLDFTTSITVNRVAIDSNMSLLRSPARKVPQSAYKDINSPARKAPQNEYKDSLKESPRKLNFGDSLIHAPFKPSAPIASPAKSSFKASLLQSPARRPPSPVKSTSSNENGTSSTLGATPKASQFKISRFATPKTTSKSIFKVGQPAGGSIVRPNTTVGSRFKVPDSSRPLNFPSAAFSGRLSAIVPRDVDPVASPAKDQPEPIAEEVVAIKPESIEEELPAAEAEEVIEEDGPAEADPMLAIENKSFQEEIAMFQSSTRSTTPPSPPPQNSDPVYQLRPEIEDPFQDSDSEDELAPTSIKCSPAPSSPSSMAQPEFEKMPQTPNAFEDHMTNVTRSSGTVRARRTQIGFTPLARQLSDWMGASPQKDEESDSTSEPASPTMSEPQAQIEQSPTKSGFFDDEMLVRDTEIIAEDVMDVDGEIVMNEVELDEEDMALAVEADEMSLIGPAELDDLLAAEEESNSSNEVEERLDPSIGEDIEEGDVLATPARAVSECSQEYGDENEMPIDPALLLLDAQLPQTPVAMPPKASIERVFHTVSKVPLKPAAEDSPIKYSPVKRGASSVSRMPMQHGGLKPAGRSVSAFSFSPSKRPMKSRQDQPLEEILDEITTPRPSETEAPQTPWSSAATPARTPRNGLNEQLLKGAVVYVDVHTTEGADASGIFVELLTQMGAKCVKTWTWNPNHSSSPESDGSASTGSKVGITHVVFKDGGKRTLEKVRESNGVVLCIGVGWVLE